jgi:DNA-binding protein WhiA
MSFSTDTKAELCRVRLLRTGAAEAECYGVLLYAHTFSPRELRIVTASPTFAERLPKLFDKAFSLSFDQTGEPGGGKQSFVIRDSQKLDVLFRSFGAERSTTLSHHVNFGVLEEDERREAFFRGAFLAGGSITDPVKGFHLELATPHVSVCRESRSLLQDMGFEPKEASRGGNALLYFKKADAIADFFTTLGAPVTAMAVMTAKVDKEMRNTVTRQINCDSANADKTVSAAMRQNEAIRRLIKRDGLEGLPEPLRDAALLRLANPEASLADLALLSNPPVTKSCLSHRLNKIILLAGEESL